MIKITQTNFVKVILYFFVKTNDNIIILFKKKTQNRYKI